MTVPLLAASRKRLALLGERGLLVDVDLGRMQIFDARGHHHTFHIFPRSVADPVPCIDASVAARFGRAQIGRPVCAGRAGRLASAWQWASAPARPPRSPPLPGLTLLTKNDMSACCACAAVVRSSIADVIAIKDSDAILNILNVLPFRVAMATFQSTRSITNAITACMIAHKRLCHYGNTGRIFTIPCRACGKF